MNIPAWKKSSSVIIIILCASMFCSQGRVRVKPVPVDGGYKLCPVCRGTGIFESYSSGTPQKGLELNKDEKGCTDTMGCVSFFGIAFLDNSSEEMEFDQSGNVKDNRYTLRDFETESAKSYEKVYRSNVKIKVKCERCEGKGWIKAFEPSGWSMDSGQNSEGFRRANELLNQSKNK